MEQFNQEVPMNGKGDAPRPLSVNSETFASNWERVFGSKAPHTKKSSVIDEQKFQYLTELHSGMFYEWYPGLSGDWEKDKTRWYLAKQMRDHAYKEKLKILDDLTQNAEELKLYDIDNSTKE